MRRSAKSMGVKRSQSGPVCAIHTTVVPWQKLPLRALSMAVAALNKQTATATHTTKEFFDLGLLRPTLARMIVALVGNIHSSTRGIGTLATRHCVKNGKIFGRWSMLLERDHPSSTNFFGSISMHQLGLEIGHGSKQLKHQTPLQGCVNTTSEILTYSNACTLKSLTGLHLRNTVRCWMSRIMFVRYASVPKGCSVVMVMRKIWRLIIATLAGTYAHFFALIAIPRLERSAIA